MLTTDFLYDEECQALLAPPSRNLHAIFAPFPFTYQFSATTFFAAPDRYRRTVPVIGFLADIFPLEEEDEAEVEFDETPYARLVEDDIDEWHFEWPTTMPGVPRKSVSVATQSARAVSASTGTQVVGVAVTTTATQSFSTSTASVSVGSTTTMTTTSTGVQCAPIATATPAPIPRITISTLVGTDDMAADLQRVRLVEVADALVDAVLREVAREVPAAAAEMMAQVEGELEDDMATCVGDDDQVMEAAVLATVASAVARPASLCPSASSDESGEYEWVDAAEAVE